MSLIQSMNTLIFNGKNDKNIHARQLRHLKYELIFQFHIQNAKLYKLMILILIIFKKSNIFF